MYASHWQNIYRTKSSQEVSWFAPHLALSLELIQKASIPKNDPIIDVGAGASTLPDDLLGQGFVKLTLLDISPESLEISKKRLGKNAKKIEWIAGDIMDVQLPRDYYALWHDRAVFHFLTHAEDRKKYKQVLWNSLKPQGFVLMATFSLEGPEKCSGLEVARYSPETLAKELGAGFKLVENISESHKTPFGTAQDFTYCLFQKFF